MELVATGKRITVDLYLGVMNQGEEKRMEAKTAISMITIRGFRQIYRK
jgi:hypothetical protein